MKVFPVREALVLDGVPRDALAAARAQRLLSALGVAAPVIVSRAELAERQRAWPWASKAYLQHRTGAFDYGPGWVVVLDTYRSEANPGGGLELAGRRGNRDAEAHDCVCRPAVELHAALGCYHRCTYCHCDPQFTIACDLERLAEALPALFREAPGQTLWKFDNQTDTIVLEPEYGASALLVPRFAATPDRYLMLYTKSDNVDHLLALPHGGHTIVNWSLSPPTQSRTIELGAPETGARIAAMRRCQDAGYPVRVRFSPIVPLRGWREEMVQTVERLFDAVAPDLITLDVIGWMDAEAMAGLVEPGRLEPECAAALEERRRSGWTIGYKHVFPDAVRVGILRVTLEAIRRRAPGTPVALCGETRGVWRDLAGLLRGMTPERFVCCCGPDSAPGNPLLAARIPA